jgi:hypothetical protein
MEPKFWNSEYSETYLRSRLVCLNKDYPKIGNYRNYRPITVSSLVVKFLEGYIMKSLRKYAKEQMNREQFGFIPGVSI